MASASSPVATPRIKRLPGYSGATSPGYTLTLSFISPMQFEQLWLVDGPNKPTHDLGYGVRNSRARSNPETHRQVHLFNNWKGSPRYRIVPPPKTCIAARVYVARCR